MLPTAPFNNDEESSGIIEVTDILGDADTKAYLVDIQAHYNIPGELVQGGQLLAMYVDDIKDGGTGNDRVAGDAGDNRLNGNRGDDTVLGGSGNDVLLGARGIDSLDGGRGNDVLIGGVDSDSFVFDTLFAGSTDAIVDFSVTEGESLIFGAGVTVTGVQIGWQVATSLNGEDLRNSATALDLVLTLSQDGVTQTLNIIDAYNFGSNSFWEAELGVDLSYARPTLGTPDLVNIIG